MQTALATTFAPLALTSSIEPYVDEFLAHLDRGAETIRTYRSSLAEFTRWLAASPPNGETAAELVLRYKQERMADGKGAATVAKDLAAIRALGTYLVKTGRLATNPAEDVRAPKMSKNHKRGALTLPQAIRLVDGIGADTVSDKRDAAVVALMLRAGLRDVEIVRANIGDLQEQSGQRILWVHGKGRDAADEFVVLNERAVEAIRAYLATRAPVGESSPLFVSLDGRGQGRLTTRRVNAMVSAQLQAAGLKKATITAHSLRHTAASLAIQAGASLSQVQKMCRHEDPRTTSRYVHLFDRLANAAEKTLDF